MLVGAVVTLAIAVALFIMGAHAAKHPRVTDRQCKFVALAFLLGGAISTVMLIAAPFI